MVCWFNRPCRCWEEMRPVHGSIGVGLFVRSANVLSAGTTAAGIVGKSFDARALPGGIIPATALGRGYSQDTLRVLGMVWHFEG